MRLEKRDGLALKSGYTYYVQKFGDDKEFAKIKYSKENLLTITILATKKSKSGLKLDDVNKWLTKQSANGKRLRFVIKAKITGSG